MMNSIMVLEVVLLILQSPPTLKIGKFTTLLLETTMYGLLHYSITWKHSTGVDVAYGNGIWVYVVFLTNDYWTQTSQVLTYNEQENEWEVSLNVTRKSLSFFLIIF